MNTHAHTSAEAEYIIRVGHTQMHECLHTQTRMRKLSRRQTGLRQTTYRHRLRTPANTRPPLATDYVISCFCINVEPTCRLRDSVFPDIVTSARPTTVRNYVSARNLTPRDDVGNMSRTLHEFANCNRTTDGNRGACRSHIYTKKQRSNQCST